MRPSFRILKELGAGRMTSLMLILPLLIYTIGLFVVPILLILTKAADNPEVARGLPRTSAAISAWTNYNELPPSVVFQSLVDDLRDHRPGAARDLAAAARRLNYEISGFRSLLMTAAREAKAQPQGFQARQGLMAIDPKWGEIETWTAIKRAAPRYTSHYMLAAIDMRQTVDGSIERVPEDQRAYVDILIRTLRIAGTTTLLCLLLGYPLAALMVASKRGFATLILGAILLPFWTSLLAKTSAWIVILQDNGPINLFLTWSGIVSAPVPLIFNSTGLYIVMVHMMLPFAVLPIFSIMKSVPPSYMRASSSLGAHPIRGFIDVYLPMTMPGISAGAILTFIVSAGYYITPSLVGSPREQMIGYFVAYYAYMATNWGLASALSLVLLICVLALYLLAGRLIGVKQLAGLK